MGITGITTSQGDTAAHWMAAHQRNARATRVVKSCANPVKSSDLLKRPIIAHFSRFKQSFDTTADPPACLEVIVMKTLGKFGSNLAVAHSMRQMYKPEPDVRGWRPYRGGSRVGEIGITVSANSLSFFSRPGREPDRRQIAHQAPRQCAMPVEGASPRLTRNSSGSNARKISPSTLKSSR